MKLEMYSVYDKVAQAYMPPFFTHNEGLAVRSFGASVNNPETVFFRHPTDYTLHKLGNFDDNSGEFELQHEPLKVCSAMDLKATEANKELFDEISNDA